MPAISAVKRDPEEGEISSTQARMWFLHSLDPDGSAYAVATAHRLVGHLALPALRASICALVNRHEMLRSFFPVGKDGRPGRVVSERSDPEITIVDRSGIAPQQRDSCARDEIALESRRPFDIRQSPLYRITLVHFSPLDHLLIAVFHHIIVDGWSLGIWHRELETGYAAALRREAPPHTPSAGTPFSEVARRERVFLASVEGQRALQAVVERLRDAPMLELPMAQPRPRAARFVGARQEVVLSGGLVQKVDALARATKSSRFVVLTSALAILLHRYSGQQTLLIGTPVANRQDPELHGAIGLFVNTAVLRIDLENTCSTEEVIARVRADTLRALELQNVPFDRVVDALAPQRTLSHNPVFQVMCTLHNAPASPLRLTGLEVTPIAAGTDVARFDLECTIFEAPQELRVRLVHNTDIIDAQMAENLLCHLVRVIQACVEQPELRIADITFSTRDELDRQSILEQGASLAPSTACLHEIFEERVRLTPDGLAASDGKRVLSFQEVDAWANDIANRLRHAGVARGDIVAVCLERTVALPAAILGVLKGGAGFLPIDPRDSADRQAFMLGDAGASVVVTDAPAGRFHALGVTTLDATNCGNTDSGFPRGSPDDLAYVIYTSGTEGRPKGVQITHRNIVNTLRACQDLFCFRASDCGLVLAASTFDVFYYELFAPLLGGGRVRLVSREELFDQRILAALLDSATCFQAVPGLMEHVLAALKSQGHWPCPSIRLAMTGGDVVPPALVGEMQAAFPEATVSVTYGPTEAAIFCTCFIARQNVETVGHPIGRPLSGTIVRVCDHEGRPLPVNVNGEIWIGGAGVARGYLNRPDETSRRFVDIAGERFYSSGDRGRLNTDGSIEFLGRSDRQVKIRGFRIELAEIEAVLAQAPGVRQAAIKVLGTSHAERRLAGYVVLDPDAVCRQKLEMETQHVVHWRDVFERVYGSRVRHVSDDQDFTGWNSAITGAPFPFGDLEQWLQTTIREIMRRVPATLVQSRQLRVLEIGCGSGLILQRLAAFCARYVGIDFSRRALSDTRQRAEALGLERVELHQAEAGSLKDVDGIFDVVVMNSVVQYMPNIEYLQRVLTEAASRTRSGGFIFVGDVRNFGLLQSFHAAAEMHRMRGEADADGLKRSRKRAEAEEELVIHPAFFPKIAKSLETPIVECVPRSGRFTSELCAHRYDVVLWRAQASSCESTLEWDDWNSGWTLDLLRNTMKSGLLEMLALRGIPNAAVEPDLQNHRILANAARQAGPARAQGELVWPDEVHEIAKQAGYSVRLSILRGAPDGSFDAYFERGDNAAWPQWPEEAVPATLATDPVRVAAKRMLAAAAHRFVADRLADYMVPATLTVMDSFPRTANDKIDLDQMPDFGGADALRTLDRRAPETDLERLVAAAWDAVLGQQVWAVEDDFFKAGGTSLLAVQAASLLRARGLIVSPQQIFELRTIARIAAALEGAPAASEHTDAVCVELAENVVSSPAARVTKDRWRETKCVLLTGSTGILGVHLLQEILESTNVEIVCLVRAADDHAARARLVDQYRWYFGQAGLNQLLARVEVIAGDLAQPSLALSKARWLAVQRRCDCVINVAADVRHVGDRGELLSVNHQGVRELLRLASNGSCTGFHHISTLAVRGYVNNLAKDVTDLSNAPGLSTTAGFSSQDVYAESKLLAEQLVSEFVSSGKHVSVIRIGTVAPHRVTGRFQRNIDDHFFSRYVRALLELRIACDEPRRSFRLIPVDSAARAIRLLAGAVDAAGFISHLQTPHELPQSALVGVLNAMGYGIAMLDRYAFDEAVESLGNDPNQAAALGRLLPLIDGRGRKPRPLDADGTQGVLSALEFVFPKPTPEWLERFVQFGVTLGYFPPPGEARRKS